MTLPVESNPNHFGARGYNISNSLRLRSSASAYLQRNFGTPTNGQKFTFSFWIKKAVNGTRNMIFTNDDGSGAYGYFEIYSDNTFLFGDFFAGGLTSNTRVYLDNSAWYHIVLKGDSTLATATDRVAIYINGVRDSATTSNVTQNGTFYVTANRASYGAQIGRFGRLGIYSDITLAEFNLIDGQGLDPSYFGQTDSTTGAWVPKKYGGTYGNNGFYLNFKDASAATAAAIGKDSSGNGNNLTPSGISVSSDYTNDSSTDTPTPYDSTHGNFATLNPLFNPNSMTLAAGNLAFYKTATYASIPASINVKTGKWYFECTYIADTASGYGIGAAPITNSSTFPFSSYLGSVSQSCSVWKGSSGTTLYLNGSTNTGRSITAGDTMLFALDCDNGKMWAGYYSVSAATAYWFDSAGGITGNPSTGANASATFTVGTLMAPGVSYFSSGTYQYVNFGQRAFTVTPPTGFKRLQTWNLPKPSIQKPNKYFGISTWSGNDVNGRTITDQSFKPDLVWVKNRASATFWHVWFDAVRGAGNQLTSNATDAELASASNLAGKVSSFNANGFTLSSGSGAVPLGSVNGSGGTYVAWQWKAGNSSGVTNTSGSISSTVSADTTAGFSVVGYAPTSGAQTIGHGLGVAPSLILLKCRTGGAGYNWAVYHKSLTSASYFLRLNTSDSEILSTAIWNGTAPTSSVFSIGTDAIVNAGAGSTYVAYCWAEVAGFSSFGSYVGNGSSDGPFINCGFRPALVIVKGKGIAYSWKMFDSTRSNFNPLKAALWPNLSDAEGTSSNFIDIYSNGFKLRDTDAVTNNGSSTYIYIAFAELPFNYALAR